MMQEWIAFAIVGIAAGALAGKAFRSVLARPLAEALLRRGKVKLAMKLHAQARDESGSCGGCKDK
jgi:hypothetical protein